MKTHNVLACRYTVHASFPLSFQALLRVFLQPPVAAILLRLFRLRRRVRREVGGLQGEGPVRKQDCARNEQVNYDNIWESAHVSHFEFSYSTV